MIILISVFAFLALSFCAFLLLIKPGKRRDATDKFKNLAYAHRGLHGGGRAENSLSAFKAAADAVTDTNTEDGLAKALDFGISQLERYKRKG